MKHVLALVAVAVAVAGLCCAEPTDINSTVDQRAFAFSIPAITIKRGSSIRFTNSDVVVHNVIVVGSDNTVDGGSQKPGQVVRVDFPDTGIFKVMCAIHPRMKMRVTVE
jgi:plastocyanin